MYEKANRRRQLIKALFFNLIGTVPFGLGIWIIWSESVPEKWGMLGAQLIVVGIIFGPVGLSLLKNWVADVLGSQAFETIDFNVEPASLEPGDETHVTVDLEPNEPLEVTEPHLELTSWEIQENPQAPQGHRRQKEVFCDRRMGFDDQEARLDALARGESVTLEANVRIPTDVDLNVGAQGPLNWRLTFSANVPGPGNITRERELLVDEQALM